jgi:hypothetical protein
MRDNKLELSSEAVFICGGMTLGNRENLIKIDRMI